MKINNIEIYSTYNEGKFVFAGGCIRTLKNKIFKHIKAVSKNVYFDVLDGIVSKCNNTVHRTIKMKPIDVTFDSYAEYNEDSNVTMPKFKGGDHARISKYKIIFAKGYTQKKFLLLVKVKTQFRDLCFSGLNGEPITGIFYAKELQKTNQKVFRIEKIIKRKGDKLYHKFV